MQLNLFNTQQLLNNIEITYWSKPYNKKGYIDKDTPLKKYIEITEQGSALIRYIQNNPYEYKYLTIKKLY